MRKLNAFTLIELLISLVIISILSLIAVPSYLSYIRKSRRIDGIQSIYALRLAEEKYRASNTQYGTLVQIQALVNVPLSTYYNFTITNLAATTYTITATGTGTQTGDTEGGTACNILTFTVNNTAETKTPAVCWT